MHLWGGRGVGAGPASHRHYAGRARAGLCSSAESRISPIYPSVYVKYSYLCAPSYVYSYIYICVGIYKDCWLPAGVLWLSQSSKMLSVLH